MQLILLAALLVFTQSVSAHVAAMAWGMYCLNGLKTWNDTDLNSFTVVQPLYNLTFDDWFLHGKCRNFPPAPGDFLDITAGGSFTVDIAGNRGQTRLSFNGSNASDWPDGGQHPDDMNMSPGCIVTPNLHTQNESMAAGTAFAISYESDIKSVTPENLVVFSVVAHTPWKRLTSYPVPADLPPCPPGGCHCAWGWVANGCGEPNMYQNAFRCQVLGSTSTRKVGKGQPPVWCEDDPSKCVKGPKQMIAWNQLTGDNIEVDGWDLSGGHKSPGYNTKCGWTPGPQNDIFEDSPVEQPPPSTSQNPPSTSQNSPSTSQDIPSSSQGAPVPSPTPSMPPNSLVNNGTTSTATSMDTRPSRCPRSLEGEKLVKKSSIVHGVASHLKRRRLARRST